MMAFVNGSWLPEDRAVVSIFDRSFRYGDGLFEAILLVNGKPFRWPQHAARLECSASFLKMPMPYSQQELLKFARELASRNQTKDAILRIQLSRGVGPRGYAPSGEEQSLVVMTLHPAPSRTAVLQWKLAVSSLRVAAHDPLTNHKTCSRLLQVVAATEARERGADECLLLNSDGEITEGGSSNLFWINQGTVCTPPLTVGALPGVTRAVILECCRTLAIPQREENIRPEQLREAEGVFLSLTSRGIVEAASIDAYPLLRSPLTQRLRSEMERLIATECS
jgi:aminodeoxychorismate lyase